jgi:hypothetical protein
MAGWCSEVCCIKMPRTLILGYADHSKKDPKKLPGNSILRPLEMINFSQNTHILSCMLHLFYQIYHLQHPQSPITKQLLKKL